MLEGKRVVFPAPGKVELETFSLDEHALGPTEAVVRTQVTVISPGTELARLSGKGLGLVDTPEPERFLPGYASIGTVLAAGADVQAKPGDRVYTMAHHASVARIDTRRQLCVPVPPRLASEEAVFVRLATVSMTTLLTTIARGGDAVAIVGLGLVGNLAAQIFQQCGMCVSAVDRSAARRAVAERCGLGAVYSPDDLAGLARRHRLVIEASGSAAGLVSAVGLTASGGEIVMVGAPWGGDKNSVPSGRLTGEIFLRFLRLRSGSEWEIPRQPEPLAPGSIHQNSVTALNWLAAGRLRVAPLITHRLPPEAAPEAYAGLRDRPDDYLGVIFVWDRAG
ncbi:MAG: zinc-dependent alcohol dehydrogenase [Thermomicrobiales bacterium]